jgi:acyl dehydratase
VSTARPGRPAGARFDDVQVGDQIPGRVFTLSRADLVRYAGASGDLNPIHWSDRTARDVGLPGVIAHGMLTMATAVRSVTEWVGDPGAVVEYGVRFASPVLVDDVAGAHLRVSGVVATKDEATRSVRVDLSVSVVPPDAGGASASTPVGALTRARAVVRLP